MRDPLLDWHTGAHACAPKHSVAAQANARRRLPSRCSMQIHARPPRAMLTACSKTWGSTLANCWARAESLRSMPCSARVGVVVKAGPAREPAFPRPGPDAPLALSDSARSSPSIRSARHYGLRTKRPRPARPRRYGAGGLPASRPALDAMLAWACSQVTGPKRYPI
jgi:hypothetical protein